MILENASCVDEQRLQAALRFLVERVGARPTGSRGGAIARRWLISELEREGVRVTTRPFPLVVLGKAGVEFIVAQRPVPAAPFIGLLPAFPYQIPPQRRTINAPLYLWTHPCPDDGVPNFRGSIVVIDEYVSDRELLLILASRVARNSGVAFVVPAGCDQACDLVPFSTVHLWYLRGLHLFENIPVIEVAREHLGHVIERAREGSSAQIFWGTHYRVSAGQIIRVVVPPTDGSPNERVLVAAHYDSAYERPDCPGANDNAVGVAIALELVRCYRDLVTRRAFRAGRAVEFMFYEPEEYDAVGCWATFLDLSGLPSGSVNAVSEAYATISAYATELFSRDAARAEQVRSVRVLTDLIEDTRVRHVIEIDTIGAGENLVVASTSDDGGLFTEGSPLTALARTLFPKAQLQHVDVPNNIAARMRALGLDVDSLMLQLTGGSIPFHTSRDNFTAIDVEAARRMAVLHLGAILQLSS